MKKNGLILSIIGILSQLWLIYMKILNSDIGYNLTNGRSHGLSDGLFGFFYIGIFLYISITVFLYSIGKNNFHSNVGKKIYLGLKLEKLNLTKYFKLILYIIVIFLIPFVYIISKINKFNDIEKLGGILFVQFLLLLFILMLVITFFNIIKNKEFWVSNGYLKINEHPIGFVFYLIIYGTIFTGLLFFINITGGKENFINFYKWLLDGNLLF